MKRIVGIGCAALSVAALAIFAMQDRLHAWHFNLQHPQLKYPMLALSRVGDGGPATAILLQDPMGLAEDDGGNVYIADRGRRIWRVDPAGSATVIAGRGLLGSPVAGGQASATPLGSPEALAFGPEGRLHFADSAAHAVWRIEHDGRLSLVAGNGIRGFDGENGPAAQATLDQPFDLDFDSRGNLFIADFGNHCVRRVDRDGTIVTVAGRPGRAGYSGDGGHARAARLDGAYGIAIDSLDRLLIADCRNHVIRRVDVDGTISTIAGTGTAGEPFNTPESIDVDAAGRIYIGDELNHRVRVIDTDGAITTVAGDGRAGFAGDGGPAIRSRLNDPENVLVRSDGAILISDGENMRVRIVATDSVITTFAGGGPG